MTTLEAIADAMLAEGEQTNAEALRKIQKRGIHAGDDPHLIARIEAANFTIRVAKRLLGQS